MRKISPKYAMTHVSNMRGMSTPAGANADDFWSAWQGNVSSSITLLVTRVIITRTIGEIRRYSLVHTGIAIARVQNLGIVLNKPRVIWRHFFFPDVITIYYVRCNSEYSEIITKGLRA